MALKDSVSMTELYDRETTVEEPEPVQHTLVSRDYDRIRACWRWVCSCQYSKAVRGEDEILSSFANHLGIMNENFSRVVKSSQPVPDDVIPPPETVTIRLTHLKFRQDEGATASEMYFRSIGTSTDIASDKDVLRWERIEIYRPVQGSAGSRFYATGSTWYDFYLPRKLFILSFDKVEEVISKEDMEDMNAKRPKPRPGAVWA